MCQDQYDSRDSPMYTELQSAGAGAAQYGALQLAPPSPGKYPAPGPGYPAPPYSPTYQYAPYPRPQYSDVLGQLYPVSGYPSHFSYDNLGRRSTLVDTVTSNTIAPCAGQHPASVYETNGAGMGKTLGNYGGIYVPSAAATSALPSKQPCLPVVSTDYKHCG